MKNKNEKSSLMKEEKQKEEKQELPSCCAEKPKKEPKNVGQAILYGIIPHVGCIAFIIGSVLGVTVLTQLFKPLLMNRNFFYILILISLLLATVSSVLYLRKIGFLSAEGIRRKWKYLTTMYGVTIGVNLLLFLVIFPLVANVSSASSLPAASSPQEGAVGIGSTATADLASLKLKVDIPCSGHAPLISNELKTISGVQSVVFSFPNNFDVTYDPAKTSKEQILALSVFNEYKATVLSEFAKVDVQQNTAATAQASAGTQTSPGQAATGGCGCGGSGGGCGGSVSGGCGGAGGGCGGSVAGGCGGAGAGTGSAAGTCGVKY